MLRAGGDGAAARATRLLERAAELAATPFVPPDIHAKLGIARWSEACDKERGGQGRVRVEPRAGHRARVAPRGRGG